MGLNGSGVSGLLYKPPFTVPGRYPLTLVVDYSGAGVTVAPGSGTFSGVVDWGDGQVELFNFTSITHNYATNGTYIVKVWAEPMPGLYLAGDWLQEVVSLGDIDYTGDQITINGNNLTRFTSGSYGSIVTQVVTLTGNALASIDFRGCDTSGVLEFQLGNTTALQTANFTGCNLGGLSTLGNFLNNSGLPTNGLIGFNYTGQPTSLFAAFTNAPNFNPAFVANTDPGYLTSAANAFDDSGLTNATYGAILIAWAAAGVRQPNVTVGASTNYYPASAAAARTLLEGEGWIFNDLGQEP